jgi:hypothetical protein
MQKGFKKSMQKLNEKVFLFVNSKIKNEILSQLRV